jgi:hypothetical protein
MSNQDYFYATLDKEILGRDAKYADINTSFRTFLRDNWAVINVPRMPKDKIIVTTRQNLRFGYNDALRAFKFTNLWADGGSHDNFTRLTIGFNEAINYMWSQEIATYGLKAAN